MKTKIQELTEALQALDPSSPTLKSDAERLAKELDRARLQERLDAIPQSKQWESHEVKCRRIEEKTRLLAALHEIGPDSNEGYSNYEIQRLMGRHGPSAA